MRKLAKILWAIAALIGIIVVVSIIAGGNPTATTATQTNAAPAPSAQSTRVAHVHRIITWFALVQPGIKAVTADLGTIQQTSGRSDLAGVTAACAQLKSDVASVQAAPRAPDRQIRAGLDAAMSDYATMAQRCLNGDLAAAADAGRAGDARVSRVTTRVMYLNRTL